MKKLILLLLTLSLCLWAADFWQAKPYTEWSEKDCTKLMSNSPWAKQVTVTVGGGGNDGGMSGGRRRGGSNDRPGMPNETGGGTGAVGLGSGGSDRGSGMGGQRGGGSDTESMSGMGGGGGQGVMVTMVWQSALPVKQASIKKKYGSEAAQSEDGKKYIQREEPNYVLSAGPFPPAMLRMKDALMETTMLTAKGKTPIKPVKVDVAGGNMVLIAFPKSAPLTAEDGEVEFVSKIGPSPVKVKFDLKKMVFNGKLEL